MKGLRISQVLITPLRLRNCKANCASSRYFASTPVKKSEDKKSVGYFKGYNGMVLGSAALATTGVSYLLYDVTYNFMSLTPASSLYYGFIAGALSATTTAGAVFVAERWSRLNPDRALSAAMKIVRTHPKVAEIVGEGLSSGNMRSYNIQRGGISFKRGLPTLHRPEVQLSFVVKGINGPALITAVYSVFGLREKLVYCGISWQARPGQAFTTASLVGDKDQFTSLNDFKAHGKALSELS